MKKLWYGLLGVAVFAAGIGFVATNTSAMSFLDRNGESANIESSTQILDPVVAPDAVIVEAIVVPQRQSDLSVAASGIVADVFVDEGAYVTAGTALLQLNTTRQQAAVAQAEANLRNAELKLAEMKAPPRAEELARYQAGITSAQASLQKVLDGPNEAEITSARVELANAEAALRQAQSDFDEIAWRTDIGMMPQATALEQATNSYVRAKANYDELLKGATSSDISGASAQVRSAQADLDLLMAGAQDESIAAAAASVSAAQATLSDAQAALDQLTLRAPFAGTVAAVNAEVGEQVSPGFNVVTLADFSNWRLETDDLTELGVVNVQPGDRVEITIDALAGTELAGRVLHIKPIGENKLGDITYTAEIELDEQDERLRWNMTAQTTILLDEAGRSAAALAQPRGEEMAVDSPDTRQEISTLQAMSSTDLDVDVQQSASVTAMGPLMATVNTSGDNLNVRAGPGTGYAIVGKAIPAERLPVQGRTPDTTWLLVQLPDQGLGWVSADYVGIEGNLESLPTSTQVVETPGAQPVSLGPAASLIEVEEVANATSGLQGTLVFQSSSGGTIHAYEMASGELRTLTYGMDPAVSADGQTVAFVRAGGEHGLYLIDIDGSNERMIYNGGENLRAPSWSPDGEWIVFSRRTGEFSCREIGSGLCFPDNQFLGGFPLVNQAETGLSRVDINGQNFSDLPTLTSAAAAAWGDGGVVYQSSAGIQLTSDAPDATTQPVVAEYRYQDPDWQPNGGRIVFHSLEGNHREIFTANVDGSDMRSLTRPEDLLAKEYPQNVAPVWSPDGQNIAFLSNRNEEGTVGEWAIWVMDAGGNNPQRLPIGADIAYSFQGEQVLSW